MMMIHCVLTVNMHLYTPIIVGYFNIYI
jgi:hypothetical protein